MIPAWRSASWHSCHSGVPRSLHAARACCTVVAFGNSNYSPASSAQHQRHSGSAEGAAQGHPHTARPRSPVSVFTSKASESLLHCSLVIGSRGKDVPTRPGFRHPLIIARSVASDSPEGAELATAPLSMEQNRAPFSPEAIPEASGYLPISADSNSKLHFCYYEARNPGRALEDTPILLWLNGGPGCSSMIGNFYELGPYVIRSLNGDLERNDHAWNSRYGVLFIDNPVGTGFSIAASESDIPLDQATCAEHLHHALLHFFAAYPHLNLRGRPLFLTGESYAGKYVPALACRILDHLRQEGGAKLPYQFIGVAIGNGFTDPRTQVQVHAEVMRSFGMLDEQQALHVEAEAEEVVKLVDKEQWVEAHHRRTALCEWIEESAGIPTLLDIRRHAKYHATEDKIEFLAPFLNRAEVKAALNVEPSITWVSCRPHLRLHMACDTMKSYKYMVERLLEEGRPTLLFQGMYDAKDGPLCTERWLRTMDGWQGTESFFAAPRHVWRSAASGGTKLAGYTRAWGSLTWITLIGAGHQVPADQPENALEMIEMWVEQQMAGWQNGAPATQGTLARL